jgi:hypothetical protein
MRDNALKHRGRWGVERMKIIVALLLVLTVFPIAAEDTAAVHIGPLILQFPSGWQTHGRTERVEGKGPQDERMIANYSGVKPSVTDPSKAVLAIVHGFAREKMTELAEKSGKVVRAVTEESLANGRVEFSAVSQGKKMFRDYYLLQYLFTSTRGMIYITVEGYGEAAKAAESFEGILASQQWID